MPIPTPVILAAGGLSCTLEGGLLTLWDAERGHRLAVVPLAGCLGPRFADGVPDLSAARVECLPGRLEVVAEGSGVEVRSVWAVAGDRIEITGRIRVLADRELCRVDLLPPGTLLNLWDVVNYRNRHHCPEAWPELLLGGRGCETDTTSRDWQFAPHPSMMILRRADLHLFLGAIDLPTAYGMHLRVAEQRVVHCHLDYGDPGEGLALAAGTAFDVPAFTLFLDRRGSVAATLRRWTDALVERGAVPDPASRVRHAWHTEPVYCTWIDQCARAQHQPPAALEDQAAQASPSLRALDQDLVREALAVIRRERLPFRTIIIDEGWSVARGDWRAHPQRFPDLRRLVDEIHAAGLKAVVWWGWAEIARHVHVDPSLLIAGGRANRHGQQVYDYASPEVQRRLLEPLFHRFMSSDPGCYDLDGIKTDFMADKVHAGMPPGDPAWRGEENHFVRFYALVQRLMRRHKPDAVHHGYAGHPWLADLIDVNRTADVASTDLREHLCRGGMLEATCPGCPVMLDFHTCMEHLDGWFELGRRRGWGFQVSNLLMARADLHAPWEPAGAAYYDALRAGLAR